MRKKGYFTDLRLLELVLLLTASVVCGCADSVEPSLAEPVLSVDEIGETHPEVDGDIYYPQVNLADLPQLELTPLDVPGIATDERVEDWWGDFNPAYPERSRTRPRKTPIWVPLPHGTMSGELHDEIVAFLRKHTEMQKGEFQICRVGCGIKDICTVLRFTNRYSPNEPVKVVAIETEKFQVERVDGHWQIRSITVALPDVSDEPNSDEEQE